MPKPNAKDRKVVYPHIKIMLCLSKEAQKPYRALQPLLPKIKDLVELRGPIDAAFAKELLGYREEEKDGEFGDDFLLVNRAGNRVRCDNNRGNRDLNLPTAQGYGQDQLNRVWADSRNGEEYTINGETIVLTKTGEVASAQHRLLGLCDAHERWEGKGKTDQAEHWKDKWSEPPSIEGIIVCGVSDDHKVIRTLDNVLPRTTADVLAAIGMFKTSTKRARRTMLRTVEYAVRVLWHRCRRDQDAFSPRRTNSEIETFVQQHKRIGDAVKHIYQLDQDHPNTKKGAKNVVNFIGLGVSSASLYLMASSKSNPDKYMTNPTERVMDFSLWEEAAEFWKNLASKHPEMNKVLDVLREAADPETGTVTQEEKIAILSKAWKAYIENAGTITGRDVSLVHAYEDRAGGSRKLNEAFTFGGIDLYELPAPEEEAVDLEDEEATEEVEELYESDESAEDKKTKKRARQAAKLVAKRGDNGDGSHKELAAKVELVRQQHKDTVILLRTDSGYSAYGPDAAVVARVVKAQTGVHDGIPHFGFSASGMGLICKGLAKNKAAVLLCEIDKGGGIKVHDAPKVG